MASPSAALKVRMPITANNAWPSAVVMLGKPAGPAHGPQAMLRPGNPWLRR